MIVPLFGTGLEGKSETISSQHRINCYAELQKDQDKSPMSIIGTPGLELFCDLDAILDLDSPLVNTTTYGLVRSIGQGGIRGLFSIENINFNTSTNGTALVVARGSTVVHVDSNGNALFRSDVQEPIMYGDTPVDFAPYNQGALGTSWYMMADGGKPIKWAPAYLDRPNDADAIFADTIAVFGSDLLAQEIASPRMYLASLTPAEPTWDPLDFATAEAQTDNLVRVFRHRDTIHLFGSTSTEFWSNTGNADFAYQPVKGAAIEWGLAARWSVAPLGGAITFLGSDRSGQVRLVRLNGYQAIPIIDHEWAHIINGYSRVDDAEAFGYTLGDHPFYQITFPTEGKTWVYDGSTNMFSELQSWDSVNHCFGRHRARFHAYAWGDHFVCDYENGKIYKLKPDVYSDNGSEIRREIRSRHFFKDYDRVTVRKLQFDMEAGHGITGDPTDSAKVMLQYSTDGGKGWSNELWEDLGVEGDTAKQVEFRNLGIGRDHVYKIHFSDASRFVLTGASIEAVPARR